MSDVPSATGYRAAGAAARTMIEVVRNRMEGREMNTDFTLEELRAMRRIADSSRAAPSGNSALWQAIFDKLSMLIADAVCKEPELKLPAQEEQDAA